MPTPLLSVPAEAASLPKTFLFLLPTCPWLLPPHSYSMPATRLWNQLHPSSLTQAAPIFPPTPNPLLYSTLLYSTMPPLPYRVPALRTPSRMRAPLMLPHTSYPVTVTNTTHAIKEDKSHQ